ncbi:6,7-dimethyl-8-ribityllumazine synthase [Candidatus Tremblaya phenacola]|uniref:6,7-dimethyl-8-ribityllumazine synthase n=1 Tax=Candidatus Tremblayella phenacoccinincola TaxID=1010676 RepID=A0A2G0V763_9PROT|nr:6,7-dimethyl-8-ribityllumazine synthase [Candidatus Tremblaya phenacola]PHN16316.1 6,7-dimethyl-8-ribityllumazine synthase [Candidatus Tremblaya phenacola]
MKSICSSYSYKVVVIIARFNYFISKTILKSVVNTIKLIAAIYNKPIDILWVSGSNEMQLIVNSLLYNKRHNIIIPIGTIIRGDTIHFKTVVSNCNLSYNNITINNKLSITSGMLITDNIDQAIERTDPKAGYKGAESIVTILELVNIMTSSYI